jgi:uncharacterized membrane protein YphA (DoxX/SURF4 family)
VDTVVLVARGLLAAVFLIAGVGKLLDLRGARDALFGFGVPPSVARLAGPLVPVAELATAVALVFHPTAHWGGVAALGLLLLFLGGIGFALARGEAPSCHCFGIFHSSTAGRGAIYRNAALAAAAALVVAAGPGYSVSWLSGDDASETAAVILAMAAFGLAAAARHYRKERGWYEDQFTKARKRLDAIPPGLPIDGLAPKFDVPLAEGAGRLTLDGLTGAGAPTLLIFMDPGCRPCTELVPDLARWQTTLGERLTIAVVSSDQSEPNEHAGHGLARLAVQPTDLAVSHAYRIRGTPAGVLISPSGRIVSSLAQGAQAIEALVRLTLDDVDRIGRHRSGAPVSAL